MEFTDMYQALISLLREVNVMFCGKNFSDVLNEKQIC